MKEAEKKETKRRVLRERLKVELKMMVR